MNKVYNPQFIELKQERQFYSAVIYIINYCKFQLNQPLLLNDYCSLLYKLNQFRFLRKYVINLINSNKKF